MDHKAFVSSPKSMLIAPAGYGKTHAITESLMHTDGKQLILTHTHAGIASIKEKINKAKIPVVQFHIETITSYAQKYVQAYYTGNDMPSQDDSDNYYSFIISKARDIVKMSIIQRSISLTYTGLFIDEYQDCTLMQHEFISKLSNVLPTHILGDPLQGIFSFNGAPMVDLENSNQMGDYRLNQYTLDEPWRWKEKNEQLGECLKDIRSKIENHQNIDLSTYPAIEIAFITDPTELYNPTKPYYKSISLLLSEKNVLLIHPNSTSINVRLKIIKGFRTPITLLESIDDKDFYTLSKLIDTATPETIEQVFMELCLKLFNKTGIEYWFNSKGLIAKRASSDKLICEVIQRRFNEIKTNFSYIKIAELIKYMSGITNIRCYRKELFISICSALYEAETNNMTIYDSMVVRRNNVRRIGRKVYGKCIGTTLLTKGLEFDTVVVLNAHDFHCPKNLYVALTRASKRLIVFTNNPVLQPSYN